MMFFAWVAVLAHMLWCAVYGWATRGRVTMVPTFNQYASQITGVWIVHPNFEFFSNVAPGPLMASGDTLTITNRVTYS